MIFLDALIVPLRLYELLYVSVVGAFIPDVYVFSVAAWAGNILSDMTAATAITTAISLFIALFFIYILSF